MRVLLLSMPDSFEHMPALAVRMPNGALTSLAGNVDKHHAVAVADLILVQSSVRAAIEHLMRAFEPDLVGLSVMTFQRHTALKVARLIRARQPAARIAVGGYDPSLAPDAYESCPDVDFIVRGEGEHTLNELLRALEGHREPGSGTEPAGLGAVAGLSYRTPNGFVRNAPRPVTSLASCPLRLPNRDARVLGGYTLLGRKVDVVETSRGCTFDCRFCSIIEMRGRGFHPYPIDRVLTDIADACAHGAEAIFFVDDNITLDIERFEALCRAIVDSGFGDVDYLVQAMTAPFAQHGARLAPLMRRAGFRYVFLGIENIIDQDLAFLRARAKNAKREHGRTIANASLDAIAHLHRHGLYVVGGLIVGNPDDTRESIQTNLDFAARYIDWPYIQHPTPYPGTPMARDFRDRGLIVDQDVAHYDGTTAVVRSAHVGAEEIEFLRWRAERWMKVRHMPAAFRYCPRFVLANAWRMLAHTFAGSTLRSAIGLEDAAAVFARFRARRRAERDYLRLEPHELAPAATLGRG